MSSPSHIVVYVCSKCSWKDINPADNCPHCHSPVVESQCPGLGKVATFTVIRYPPKGFEEEAPYVVALVDIESGPRVIGRVSANPDRIEVGSTVALKENRNGVLEFRLA
jgi:uncharacterized OB-fold protein